MFEGFSRGRATTGDVEINYVVGGSGPALLLLHGYPQTHAQWALVAPLLAEHFTVICSDLRGYGDSGKPRDTGETYSFRNMAADQLALMTELGHEQFHVAGHDRGGRVAHRLTLDAPERVLSLIPCDLVPTKAMYDNVSRKLAAQYWQWYFLPLQSDMPERLIAAAPDVYFENCLVANGGSGLDAYEPELIAEYRRCWNDPAMIHASCADYRAGATIDLEHDDADLGTKVQCPVLALHGGNGILRTLFDIEAEWNKRCADVTATAVPAGHFFTDLAPQETAEAIRAFIQR